MGENDAIVPKVCGVQPSAEDYGQLVGSLGKITGTEPLVANVQSAQSTTADFLTEFDRSGIGGQPDGKLDGTDINFERTSYIDWSSFTATYNRLCPAESPPLPRRPASEITPDTVDNNVNGATGYTGPTYSVEDMARIGPTSKDWSTLDGIRTNLAARSTVDYETIFGSGKVTYIKEDHTVLAHKDELIQAMPELKQIGVTSLGMEMFPSSMQGQLDAYFNSTSDGSELRVHLDTWWDKGPGISARYMDMVTAARTNGIRVIGIDSPEFLTQDRSSVNGHWASTITGVLNNTEGRMVVFGGSGHFGYPRVPNGTVNQMVESSGIQGSVMLLSGGKMPPEDPYFQSDKVTWVANKEGLGTQRFMVPTGSKDVQPGADFIIHVPRRDGN